MMFPVSIRIGPGELADRSSILTLKAYSAELAHAARQKALDSLNELTPYIVEAHARKGEEFRKLDLELHRVNTDLWHLESEIRRNLKGENSPAFWLTAAAITKGNDRRAALKRKIDLLFSYEPEIKSHVLPEV